MGSASIVLVHGGWDSPSSWRWVEDELMARGHEHIVAVDLPSCSSPTATLVDDANAVVETARRLPAPVLLVGHSYGATVVSQAGVDAGAAHIVYLCGSALAVGESWVNAGDRADPALPGGFEAPPFAHVNDDGTWVIKQGAWQHILDSLPPEVAADLAPRRRQSVRPFTTVATSSAIGVVPSTYVWGSGEPVPDPDPMLSNCDTAIKLDGGHFLLWTHAADVAAIIDRVAS